MRFSSFVIGALLATFHFNIGCSQQVKDVVIAAIKHIVRKECPLVFVDQSQVSKYLKFLITFVNEIFQDEIFSSAEAESLDLSVVYISSDKLATKMGQNMIMHWECADLILYKYGNVS